MSAVKGLIDGALLVYVLAVAKPVAEVFINHFSKED